MSLRYISLSVVAAVLLFVVFKAPTLYQQLVVQPSIMLNVKSKLTDPDSAVFRNNNGFCGEVNSKNRLGGYTGFQRYIAPDQGFVMFENNIDKEEFAEKWKLWCELSQKQRDAEIERRNCAASPDLPFCKK